MMVLLLVILLVSCLRVTSEEDTVLALLEGSLSLAGFLLLTESIVLMPCTTDFTVMTATTILGCCTCFDVLRSVSTPHLIQFICGVEDWVLSALDVQPKLMCVMELIAGPSKDMSGDFQGVLCTKNLIRCETK